LFQGGRCVASEYLGSNTHIFSHLDIASMHPPRRSLQPDWYFQLAYIYTQDNCVENIARATAFFFSQIREGGERGKWMGCWWWVIEKKKKKKKKLILIHWKTKKKKKKNPSRKLQKKQHVHLKQMYLVHCSSTVYYCSLFVQS
jgi:hypothetical protein